MYKLFIFVLVFFCFDLFSQNADISNQLRFEIEKNETTNRMFQILVEADISKLTSLSYDNNLQIHYSTDKYASISCSAEKLAELIEKKVVTYAELASHKKQPLNDTMVYRNRIKPVKVWTSPLPQAYNGEGVIMGIIDTGIDFSHPDFKDSLGKTRIKFIWDQTQTGAGAPSPYNYGREWTATQINNNQCTHSDALYYGHGTHAAGIAAGNGLANGKHEGIASKSEIIAVAINFNRSGSTIADAVNYIFTKAQAMGKPCVINISLGDYYGSHDGTDLEAKMIDGLVRNKPGRVIVAAAGNAGPIKFHTKTPSTNTDTVFTWLKNSTNTIEYWCYGDTLQFKNLQISVGVNRPNFINIGNSKFRNYKYSATAIKRDTIFYNTKRIGIIEMSSNVNSSGVCEWYYKIKADSLNYLWRIETTGNGLQHAWNFDFVSNGLPNATQYPKIVKYMNPDTFYTMVSGFQNSDEVITVGNYVNLYQYKDVNNQTQSINETGGKLAQSSSSGPTRDGRIKPDITATGNSVFSAVVLSLKSTYIAVQPQNVALGGMHVLGGGTSAASPVVAGLAALYLQRYPTATNQMVKDAIRYCAYQDQYTGTNLPNYQWGFGKLDGKAAMTCSDVKVFTGIKAQENALIKLYPNPTKEQITLINVFAESTQ